MAIGDWRMGLGLLKVGRDCASITFPLFGLAVTVATAAAAIAVNEVSPATVLMVIGKKGLFIFQTRLTKDLWAVGR